MAPRVLLTSRAASQLDGPWKTQCPVSLPHVTSSELLGDSRKGIGHVSPSSEIATLPSPH